MDFSRISTPVLTDLVYDFERYCREVRDFFFVDLKALFGEEPREAPAFEGPQVPELGARFRLPVFDTELHGEPVLASCSFCAFGSEVNTGTSWYETTRVCTFPYHSESPEAEALVEASFQWHRNPLWRAAFWELEGRALSLDPLGELAARAGEGLESSPVCPRFELNPLYRDDPDVKVAREVEAEVVPNYVRIEAERRAAAVRQARELLTPPASKIERNQPDWQERALERLRQARAALPEELHVALEDPQLLFDTLNVSHGVARFMAEAARKARVS